MLIIFDIETGEEYWISGVKKNGQGRHRCGGGKTIIDRNSIDDCIKLVNFNSIDEKNFTITEFIKTDKSKFSDLENTEVEFTDKGRHTWYWDNNKRKLNSI